MKIQAIPNAKKKLIRQDQNDSIIVMFDVSRIVRNFTDRGVWSLKAKLPRSEVAVNVGTNEFSYSNNVVTWLVGDTWTNLVGEIETQLTYTIDDKVVKDHIYTWDVPRSLRGEPETPEPYIDWQTELENEVRGEVASVRASAAQIATNTSDISELRSDINYEKNISVPTSQSIAGRNLFDKTKVTLNKSYNGSLQIIDNSGTDLTDYIPVQEGKTLYVSNASIPITTDYIIYYIVTFDISKKPIARTVVATTPNPTYTVENGVAYVRYVFKHSIINGLQVQYGGVDHYSNYNENELRSVLSDVPSNMFVCDKATDTINGVTFINYGNGRIQLSGTAASELWADYYVADISNIDANIKMTLGCNVAYGSVDGLILNGYFRATRTSAALKSVTSANGVPVTFSKNIYSSPDDAKVLTLSLHLKQGTVADCIIDPTLVLGDKMVNGILNGKMMTPTQYSDYKSFNDNGWKLRMFNNAVFIGDSVTEGFIVDGDVYEVESAYSYPTQFGKTNSWMNITNKGVAGYSPYQIFNSVIPTIQPNDYDLAVIEMGYNGTDKGYLNINDYDSADTNTYYYRRVVNYMRANPDITIFIVCSSHATNNGGAGDWLPVLHKIALDYGCKVINLLDTKYINLDNNIYHGLHDGNMDYIHFNRRGYNAKAYVVSRMMADELI